MFEATFRIAILDREGRVLVDEMAMATCGTGCRGTFDETYDYNVSDGPVGHAQGVRGIGRRRQPAVRPRVPGLADARLTSADGSPRRLDRRMPDVQACLIVIRSMMLATSSALSIVSSSRP